MNTHIELARFIQHSIALNKQDKQWEDLFTGETTDTRYFDGVWDSTPFKINYRIMLKFRLCVLWSFKDYCLRFRKLYLEFGGHFNFSLIWFYCFESVRECLLWEDGYQSDLFYFQAYHQLFNKTCSSIYVTHIL